MLYYILLVVNYLYVYEACNHGCMQIYDNLFRIVHIRIDRNDYIISLEPVKFKTATYKAMQIDINGVVLFLKAYSCLQITAGPHYQRDCPVWLFNFVRVIHSSPEAGT